MVEFHVYAKVEIPGLIKVGILYLSKLGSENPLCTPEWKPEVCRCFFCVAPVQEYTLLTFSAIAGFEGTLSPSFLPGRGLTLDKGPKCR